MMNNTGVRTKKIRYMIQAKTSMTVRSIIPTIRINVFNRKVVEYFFRSNLLGYPSASRFHGVKKLPRRLLKDK